MLSAVRQGELADRALFARVASLPARDRAWVQEVVYGTLRLRARIDHRLAALVPRSLDSLDPAVLDILRLGAYQLTALGGVPPYAAVSESVELAKREGRRAVGGFVNGVLRNLLRSVDSISFPEFSDDPLGYLTTWGSHPRWLVERWVSRFGTDETRSLVELNNQRPDLFLRPVGMATDAARAVLHAAGLEAETVPLAPDSLRLSPPATAQQALATIPAVVQDPGAALVARYAAVTPGALVADLCAAPGGKSLALAGGTGEGCPRYVVASDVSLDRLERLGENTRRVGAGSLGIMVADACLPPLRRVDALLLDVPCTGTGTLRRHPDGRWRLRPRQVGAMARIQKTMLAAAASLVPAGGLLVYATCSLETEENECQVESFMREHPQFVLEPPDTVDGTLMDGEGRLSILPQRTGFDGAFAARLRRQ